MQVLRGKGVRMPPTRARQHHRQGHISDTLTTSKRHLMQLANMLLLQLRFELDEMMLVAAQRRIVNVRLASGWRA